MKARIRAVVASSSLIDGINFVFLLVIGCFMILSFTSTPYKGHLGVILPAFFLSFLAVSKIRTSANLSGRAKRVLCVLYPVLFMFLVFETFFMYLPYFNHNRYDMLLANIDVWLLGVYPTVWMEQWVRPWLTDVMYVVYFLYFPLPFLPLLTLYKRGKWFQLEGAFFSLLVCYYGGYTTYFFVPAMSPIYSLESMHRVPLEGVYFSEPIRGLIDFLEPNKLDVFPSLHTGILLTTMAITWGVSRRMFVWLLPLAAAILVSLVYCRYHYFIDIVAGAALSAASYLISQHLYRRYSTKFVPHFPAE